jgi:hypothetical protein
MTVHDTKRISSSHAHLVARMREDLNEDQEMIYIDDNPWLLMLDWMDLLIPAEM